MSAVRRISLLDVERLLEGVACDSGAIPVAVGLAAALTAMPNVHALRLPVPAGCSPREPDVPTVLVPSSPIPLRSPLAGPRVEVHVATCTDLVS